MDYKDLNGRQLVAEAKSRGIEIPADIKASGLRALLVADDEAKVPEEDDIPFEVDSEAAEAAEFEDDETTEYGDEEAEDNEEPERENYSSFDGKALIAEAKARNGRITVIKGMKASAIRGMLMADDERPEEDDTEFSIEEIPDYIQSIDGFDLNDVLSRIVSVDDEKHYVKAVIYGDNGTGKTTLAATFPSPVIIDANEKGTESVRGTGAKKFELKGWEDLYGIYWFLKSGKHNFETVIIDTMTQLEDMCLRYVMDKDIESDSTRSPEMAKIQDYGRRAQLMKSWTIYFRDLPMNVLFLVQKGTASEEVNEDESEVYPMLSDKIRKCMCGAVSVIGYTFKKEKSVPSAKDPNKLVSKTMYCLRIGPSERYLTKIRVPKGQKFKPVMIDPSFEKLVAIINNTTTNNPEEE